jgi:hypothetical protein
VESVAENNRERKRERKQVKKHQRKYSSKDGVEVTGEGFKPGAPQHTRGMCCATATSNKTELENPCGGENAFFDLISRSMIKTRLMR